jgi:multisubunit Na+/H+ antiporter MnhB subunit
VILSPNFGLTDSEGDYIERPMDQYIIDNTQSETGADNGVTAVVFDYRGFDTLGEATVLFTAVAGVIVLFRRLKKK